MKKALSLHIACVASVFVWCSSQTLACDKPTVLVSGLQKTDKDWLIKYLGLSGAERLDDSDLDHIKSKLMTTDIYSEVSIDTSVDSSGQCELRITVKEKFTRIPVVRGVYGGGTPLAILGGYETNAFGRLLAMGAEIRRYGTMKPGFFLFFKSPRAWHGRGSWGGKLWLDPRRRSFYDRQGEYSGDVESESFLTKWQWLIPMRSDTQTDLQMGFHIQAQREEPSHFRPKVGLNTIAPNNPPHLTPTRRAGYGGALGPMVASDDISVDGLNMEGIKWRLMPGASRGVESTGGFVEAEAFYYLNLMLDVNLGGHVFMGSTSQTSPGSVYYLGGFDSVRGLPDGIHYGNKIAFANIEARALALRLKYAHFQPTVFCDVGSAWMAGHDWNEGSERTCGGGIRVSVPQIFRLVLRVDYGVSLGATSAKGFSIGLNQFFQPYKFTF